MRRQGDHDAAGPAGLLLFESENGSGEEIAAHENLAVGTVDRLLHEARALLEEARLEMEEAAAAIGQKPEPGR